MIIVEDGILNIAIDEEHYKIRKGEMIIMPAQHWHKGFSDDDSKRPIKYFWSHFIISSEYELSKTPQNSFTIPLIFKITNFARVNILFNQLLDVAKLSGIRKQYCDFLFTSLCCEIAMQYDMENVSDNRVVNQAAAWIELSISSPISLDDVAAKIGYNKRYLSRVFKEYMSMTVNEFITSKKLTLAKQLLSGSDMSIASISDHLGFNDSSYFMRLFKKHEGITCSEYRNAYSKLYLNDI